MIFYCTFLWGTKWDSSYADKLFAGLRRNTTLKHKCVLISDRPIATSADENILIQGYEDFMNNPGCLVRMKVFEWQLQFLMGARQGDRITVIDADVIVTGSMDEAVDRQDEFAILQGFNTTNPCPFNGSFWTFPAMTRHDVRNDLESLQDYHDRGVPFHAFPDDQGWLHYKFPDASALTPADGFYCFKKKTWTTGLDLPLGARLVAFPGRDPAWYVDKALWIKEHWRC